MKATIAFGVGHHAVAFFVILAAVSHVILGALCKIILIDKVIACIIGRVNVDHLDLAQIGFLQELQNFQVIALNIKVLAVKTSGCTVLANTISHHRAQGCRDGRICRQHRFFLIRPCELITFLPALYNGVGKLLPQNVKINGVFYFSVAFYLGNCIGE